MAVSIRETDAKCFLWYGRSYAAAQDILVGAFDGAIVNGKKHGCISDSSGILGGRCVLIDTNTEIETLPSAYPWLKDEKLVVKPDVLLKRRGKSGLVRLDVSWSQVCGILAERLGTPFCMDGLTGVLTHFIVEPFYPHDTRENEFYVAMRTVAEGDEVLFIEHGGIDVGCVEEKAIRILIPVGTESVQPEIFHPLFKGVACDAARSSLPEMLSSVYERFSQLHFAFLEINPFCFDRRTGKFVVLDVAAKVDHTAEFLCESEWKGIQRPNPFGRACTAEEEYIRELDAKTGASLKLTILNPKGRIWTLIAGGGASVVYADTICGLGYADELCNYGEYSGAPSEVTTFEYAKTVFSLVTAPGTYRKEGKILLIGGGIANFTSVADTFRGIIRALRAFREKLQEFGVSIYVRRGGPSYQDGLRLMREVGEDLGLKMAVFGPETYITSIVPLALKDSEMSGMDMSIGDAVDGRTDDSAADKNLKGQNGASCEEMLMQMSSWNDEAFDVSKHAPLIERCIEHLERLRKEQSNKVKMEYELFTNKTRCVVYGLQTRAVQEMLDFDHVCGRTEPSVAALVYEFSVSHMRPFYFGTEEIFLPVCSSLKEAMERFPDVDCVINFASMRSAARVARQAMEYSNIKAITVIAEGVPERVARELGHDARRRGVCLIGPATVGGMKPGAFRIGNTGGSLENVMNAKLYRPGSVGFVTKSGGMLNELNNILSVVTDGACEGIAIGGDRFPGTSMLDHLLRFEHNPNIKILMLLGEVGGAVEYEVVRAMKDGRIRKPLVAWCVGTCASLFLTEVSFGHAGAWAGTSQEHACAKNAALKAAGAFVPESFQSLGLTIRNVYNQLVKQGVVTPQKETEVPRVPLDYAWAKKLGLVRKPKGFVSTISDDRGEELVYAGWPISKVMQSDLGVGGVISLLWFKRPLAAYCYRYLERVLMLTADHGPAVCGAHNVIVTARAGKDLISSLISGLCTIGDRFGGACDQAAQQFLEAYTSKKTPEEFVKDMKAKNKLIMGIGHRVKSVHNPDMRVELLKNFCTSQFTQTPLIEYALEVEKLTTKKKDTLILNVDGLIGVSMCDMLFHCGYFSEMEAKDYIANGCINGLFVLGRSIGFIGHFLDQKRLKQGLYRHDVDDIAYVLPDLQSDAGVKLL